MKRLLSGLVMAAAVLTAAPALAQDQGFSVSLGYFAPTGTAGRVTGDVLNADRCIDVTFACEPLLFNVSDFGGASINGEYIFGLGRFFEVAGGVGFYQRTVASVYQNLTFPDNSEITQDLQLRVVPITGIVRFVPTTRRSPIQPYVGIGIAALRWHYSETGNFVDPTDHSIFNARYVADGTEVSPLYLGGLRAGIGDAFLIGGEVRFQNADAPLSTDFLGNRIDLGGTSFLGTATFKFGH
jgi:outer membrane protein W